MVIAAGPRSALKFRRRFLRSGLRYFRAGSNLQSAALPPHARCTMRDAECWRGPAGGKKQYYLDQEIALYLPGSGNNGRYYDAVTGRFLSEDPTQQDGTSKDSNSQLLTSNSSPDINLYRYTGNDPVNNLDPSGHKHHNHHVYHPPQTQQGQQHNAAPPPASGGNNDNTAWLAELQGKPASTPIASLIAPSQSSADGGEVGKYLESGTAALAQHPAALGPGSLQGLANTLNTVENAADSVVNSAIAGNNLLNMGANKIAGLVDHGAAPFGMVPSIPTSNWSKGAFVSHDPARPVEKAVTGTAIAVATTFGGGAAEDAAPALAAASDAAKGLMGKVSAIAEKVGGWIKGLFGKTEEGGSAANKSLAEPHELSVHELHEADVPRSRDRQRKIDEPVKREGVKEPVHHVEINGKKFVVNGNHRLRAARAAGLKTIPGQKVKLPYLGYKNEHDVLTGGY